MLTRLSLRFNDAVDFRQSSLLQGVIMELIDTEYANFLHKKQMRPYSQYVSRDADGKFWWIIQTLNSEARREIIEKLAQIDSVTLTHSKEKKLQIIEKSLEETQKQKLMEDFYNLSTNNKFAIRFISPTAFRQKKRYVILPDTRLLIQSLMLKYSIASENIEMTDNETLEELTSKTFITRHNIRSISFHAEGQNIPGFIGSISIVCDGNQTMLRYLRLLLSFGEFSGVGIKTAMGMGAIKIVQ